MSTMSTSTKLRREDNGPFREGGPKEGSGPFQEGGRVGKEEPETSIVSRRELRGLGEEQIRSHLETVLNEFINRSQDSEKTHLINEVKSQYSGVVAVNEDSGEIIAQAEDQHSLTEELLGKNYDSESTLIIRTDERTGNS